METHIFCLHGCWINAAMWPTKNRSFEVPLGQGPGLGKGLMHETSVQMHLARGKFTKFTVYLQALCQEGVKTCQRARWKWKILSCMHPAQNSLLEANQSQARYWSGWLWPWRRKKGVSNQQTNNKHAIYCNHDQQKMISIQLAERRINTFNVET
jgi:hypothetical protein